MALPDVTGIGDLPLGVHRATLSEITDRFGVGSDRRRVLVMRLHRVYQIAHGTDRLARFVVFGSFITDKEDPNDVDIFMIMDDEFDITATDADARLLFEHAGAQDHYGCSVFWVRRLAAMGGEQAAIEDWQIKRDGTERGIVEITGE